jgi:hypothetical protein
MEYDWGSGTWGRRIAPPLPDRKMREASGRTEDAVIEGGTGHYGANCNWTHIHPTSEMSIHQYGFKAPLDLNSTHNFLVNLRNFLTEPEHDARMMERNQYVAFQDRDVLVKLRPVITPHTNTKETFVTGDETIARYRDWVKKWQTQGWRIDMDKVKADEGKVAYAIPSPARRQSKGWALDPVPLMSADDVALSQAAE